MEEAISDADAATAPSVDAVTDTGVVCSPCNVGFGVLEECSSEADTVCAPCSSGTFSDVLSTVASCQPCDECASHAFAVTSCDATHNSQCMSCNEANPEDFRAKPLDGVTKRVSPAKSDFRKRNAPGRSAY